VTFSLCRTRFPPQLRVCVHTSHRICANLKIEWGAANYVAVPWNTSISDYTRLFTLYPFDWFAVILIMLAIVWMQEFVHTGAVAVIRRSHSAVLSSHTNVNCTASSWSTATNSDEASCTSARSVDSPVTTRSATTNMWPILILVALPSYIADRDPTSRPDHTPASPIPVADNIHTWYLHT